MNLHKRETKFRKYSRILFVSLLILMIGSGYISTPVYSTDPAKQTYFVSTEGNDGNPGTLEAPWRTIQKAADMLSAGDTVYVREGVYEEFVKITKSGTAQEGHITFQAYPGEQPVLEGKNLIPTGSKNTQLLLQGASFITVQGFEIRGLSSDSSKDYLSGMKIRGGASNIAIVNNEIHDITNYASKGNAHGLIVYGDSLTPISKILITGNRIHHLISGSSESLTLDGNIEDFTVEYNRIHDNNNIGIDIIGYYNTCSSPCIDQARNGTVAHNLVYNIDTAENPAYGGKGERAAAGIYVDGGKNVIVENNEVFDSNFGVELASEIHGKTTSDVIVRNNYLHHNHGAGIIMGGSGAGNGGARDNIIMNNTLYMNDRTQQGYAEITLQHYVKNNVFLNNMIHTFPKKRFIKNSNTTGSGNRIDYNLYYRTDDPDSKSWRFNGVSYETWDAFKSATGFDENSLYANPAFTDIEGIGPHISSLSPAIDKGSKEFTSTMKVDYYDQPRINGIAIDIGAAEFSGNNTPEAPGFDAGNTPSVPLPPETDSRADESPVSKSPSYPVISINGISEDWSSVPALASGSGNVRSMKAFRTDDTLYIAIEGHLLTEKGQLFINTGAVDPAFSPPYWKDDQSGYMIENGTLYRYSGKGKTNWNWSKIRTYRNTEHYAVSSTVVEYAIPLAQIEAEKAAISIGYVWKDSHADQLPAGGKMERISSTE